jgi:predicted DNA-binding protein
MATKKMVSFRFTPEVIDLLQRQAKAQGITVTAYLKQIIIAAVFK